MFVILTGTVAKTTEIPVNIIIIIAIPTRMLVKRKFQLQFWQDGKWQDSKPRMWIHACIQL